jgi:HPt (histidine-containing phosphotransfer) domain-containing protein
MIDWARIAELRAEIGAEGFEEVVELFLEEVEAEISSLRAGCTDNALESRLHFLKGSALNLGFTAFSELCQQGESAAASGHADQVDLPATIASYDAAKIEFIKGLPRLDAP